MNTDVYFAITGSWMQENLPSMWEVKTVLLGFTQMNNAHNGIRLGQALYKVVQHLGIAHKVRSGSDGLVICKITA